MRITTYISGKTLFPQHHCWILVRMIKENCALIDLQVRWLSQIGGSYMGIEIPFTARSVDLA